MLRNYLLLITISAQLGVFWLGMEFFYEPKPIEILALEKEQKNSNEKLITAEILSNSNDRVYRLFETNMSVDKEDLKAKSASLPFLNYLTDILEKLEIKIKKLKPRLLMEQGNTTIIPYELVIECDYTKFGKFISAIEKSDRLINIDSFILNNGLERVSNLTVNKSLLDQTIEMQLSTLILKKSEN